MRAAHDGFLTLRLPAAMRRDLDAVAKGAGVRVSVATRTALAAGLRAISSPDQPEPPPAAPAARQPMQVAA